ncbi:hypothetical protein [Gemmatimonas sp.]|uniref:hypothetical protein n=1 Tax=Gemmatimonas sp. TaxID=1962908 RepID=UPI003340DF3B
MVIFVPTYAMGRRLLQGAALVLALSGARSAAAQQPPRIAGVWRGTLINLPLRPNAPTVLVTMELGAIPAADSSCVPWKTTYTERDTVRGVKDYRLCRGRGPESLYVDEGGGVILKTSLLGDVLMSSFKVGKLLLVSHLRVRGDTLEEEIVTIDDEPAAAGVVPMRTRGIQRLTLTRQQR